jgi:hypothetical protein
MRSPPPHPKLHPKAIKRKEHKYRKTYACLVFKLEFQFILSLFVSKVNICEIFHVERVAITFFADSLL